MVEYDDLKIGDTIYIIDVDPITVLELNLLTFKHFEDVGIRRLKVSNKDLSFEVDFDKIKDNLFNDKDTAMAHATKKILDETNAFISSLTDGYACDYFDVDKMVEKYKKTNPEIFI